MVIGYAVRVSVLQKKCIAQIMEKCKSLISRLRGRRRDRKMDKNVVLWAIGIIWMVVGWIFTIGCTIAHDDVNGIDRSKCSCRRCDCGPDMIFLEFLLMMSCFLLGPFGFIAVKIFKSKSFQERVARWAK
jgi:hypothetical protein